jgi:hypothetical protein
LAIVYGGIPATEGGGDMIYVSSADSPRRYESSEKVDLQARTRLKEFEGRLNRLEILCAALWELAAERLNLSEGDLRARMKDIDLRDGVEDGKITDVPLKCPACGRVSSSRHWKCLYCGLEFERNII